MRFDFQLVFFRQFHRVEKRVFHPFGFQRDFYVVDKVGKRRILQYRYARARRFARLERAFHQLPYAAVFQRGNRYYGHAQLFFQCVRVDFIPRLFHRVHHVERDDDGYVDFQKLRRQIKIPFKVGRVHHVDYAIGLFFQNKVAGNHFFRRIGRKGINSRKIHDFHGLA